MNSFVSTLHAFVELRPKQALLVCLELILVATLLAAGSSFAFAEDFDLYLKSVKPVLKARCYACHGTLKQESGLRLDTVQFMFAGGENGAVIQAGSAAISPILLRVASHDESQRMPPEGEPLLGSQIDAIAKWLNEGAVHPQSEEPERDPKDHWAFRAPERPEVPVDHRSNSSNPIDAFLAEQLHAKGLVPQPDAEPGVWLRRVSLDLIGLPPSEQQLEDFALDHSAEARQRVVEKLLTNPQYGERWGRHWMDIWRYSDWWGLGAEVRNSQKHMWHWRDWIVESLNQDAGYDSMLREMLAADEIFPNDLDRLRATGFLARQYFKFNRTSWLDETIEHTSKAMLGLTFNCCKCHDHKYDPISQEDYYRLRAVFEPYQIRTEMVPGVIDFEKDGIPRAFDCNLDLPTYLHARGDDRNPITSMPLLPAVPNLLNARDFKIEPVTLPREATQPALRQYVLASYLSDTRKKIQLANEAIRTAQTQLAAKPPEHSLHDQAALELTIAEKTLKKWGLELEAIPLRFAADLAKASDLSPEERVRVAKLTALADRKVTLANADEEVCRAELALLKSASENKEANRKKLTAAQVSLESAAKQIDAPGEDYRSLRGAEKSAESNLESEESRKKAFPQRSTGRRSAFANWLTDRQNPLAARVAVNHIWTRHFGKPLVPTVFDFGRKGIAPTHPKLLDWLAVELMDHQWSMKHIHRILVSSDAYRRTSSNAGAASSFAIDPENKYYWRMNSNRMESQMIRDSLIFLAGDLDCKMGGPSIAAADEKSRRRSLYFVHSHNEHNKMLSAFDDANVLDCYRRGESIVPQQALALENSKLAMEMVDRIAKRIEESHPMATDREFARTAFRAILADEPLVEELNWIEHMMSKMMNIVDQIEPAQRTQRARTGLVRGLINHNDFITIR